MADESRNSIYIIGAGLTGTTLAAEIRAKRIFGHVVAFLDDDPAKIGRRVDEIPVLGPIEAVGPHPEDDPGRRSHHRHPQRHARAACQDLRHLEEGQVRPHPHRPADCPDPRRRGASHPGARDRSRGLPGTQPGAREPEKEPRLHPGQEGARDGGGREHRLGDLPPAPGRQGGEAVPLRPRGKQHLRDRA